MASTTTPSRPEFQITTFPPLPNHPHRYTLIFLHGRKDTVPNFLSSLSAWESSSVPRKTIRTALPSAKLIFPQAPSRCSAGIPDKLNQWFDLYTPLDFSLKEELHLPGLQESVSFLLKLIYREAKPLAGEGGDIAGGYKRILLAGISMGGAVSLHTLFHLPHPIGGFLGFCCRLPFQTTAGHSLGAIRQVLWREGVEGGFTRPELTQAGFRTGNGEDNKVLKHTPILLEHCADDPLVKIESGRQMRDTLKSFGAERVEWKEYATGGHWFKAGEGMDDLLDFLGRVGFAEDGNGDADIDML
ncbi:putative acyl-protein thioesterase 1 [Podospora australis]|uniref:Acyl-protein thioesterase 1 n=1 Tax=Podospora australis TaxID=1536484 RepID=A0AAN6WP19_9PEZI|nr:putative acyl-protein thioesterase 1 [Podospora australis]